MAILNNLIVHGSSRFLNKAYFDILEADTGKFNKLATKVLGNDGETITVHGLMDVQGELHTKSWSNSNIATIDGSFFICPTLKVTETGSTSNGLTITQSNNTWSVQITSSSAVVTNSVYTMNSSGTVTSTGTWTIGSKVAITGEILVNNEWLPLGTLRGIITARSSDLKSVTISNITDGYSSSNNILSTIGVQNNVKHRNIKISLYEWTLSDSGTPTSAVTNPIGIYMTALGDGTGQTMIDIYGGQEPSGTTYKGLAKPYVRIGNLSGLSNITVGGQNPKGWGIYTSNGYFEGTIAARRGYIGNNTKYWTIGTSGTNSTIFSGPTTVSATGTAGTYLGTDGFLNAASNTVYAQITNGILTAKGANIAGTIDATSFSAKYYDSNNILQRQITLDAFGLKIMDGASPTPNILSQFGETTQIGKTSAAHVLLGSNEFILYDGSGTQQAFFKIKNAVNESGQVIDNFLGDGEKTSWSLSYTASNNTYVVTQNGEEVSPTKTTTTITFSTAPEDGDDISVVYNVVNNNAKSYDVGIRRNDTINGEYSIVAGYDTIASGKCSIAGGYCGKSNAEIIASGTGALTLGSNSYGKMIASGVGAIVTGYNWSGNIYASANGSIASGEVNASSAYIIAKGVGAIASGQVGNFNLATRGTIQAGGQGSRASGYVSNGGSIITYNSGNISIGTAIQGAIIAGKSSTNNTSRGGNLAIGYVSSKSESLIHAASSGTIASGYVDTKGSIVANSLGSRATGYAIDNGTIVTEADVGKGYGAIASGYASGSIRATGNGSVAIGCSRNQIEARQPGAIAIGYGGRIYANGGGAIASGYSFYTNYDNADHENCGIISSNYGALAHGYVEGSAAISSSTNEFCRMVASSFGSIALGYVNDYLTTVQWVDRDHASSITSSNLGSFACGYASDGGTMLSKGWGSVALNIATHAAKHGQTAIGTFNIEDVTPTTAVHPNGLSTYGYYAFIIGNGIDEYDRSNALTVDWNGNVDIASGAKYKINGTALSASDVGAVPTSRTVNSKALSSDITLSASDVNAIPNNGGTITQDSSSPATYALTVNDGSSNALIVDWNGNVIGQAMAGIIQMFAGSTPPTGWLICDGASYLRSDYPTLFTVLGGTSSPWGLPDDTHFNVPDFRGRAPIGAGTGTGLTARTLGTQDIGSENIQEHGHDHTNPSVTGGSCSITSSGGHTHTITNKYTNSQLASGSNSPRFRTDGNTSTTNFSSIASNTGTHTHSVPSHTHTVSGGSVDDVNGVQTGNAGNMQPSAVVNFIICTGKTS